MNLSKKLAVTVATVTALAALVVGQGHQTTGTGKCTPTAAACPLFGPIP